MSEPRKLLVVSDEPAADLGQVAESFEAVGTVPRADQVRLQTKDDALVYVQHLVREMLLEHAVRWRAMQEEATVPADRAELGLVANVAEQLASVLRAANEALCQGQASSTDVIQVAGAKPPRRKR